MNLVEGMLPAAFLRRDLYHLFNFFTATSVSTCLQRKLAISSEEYRLHHLLYSFVSWAFFQSEAGLKAVIAFAVFAVLLPRSFWKTTPS
jgi:hypothetical protein